MPKIRSPNYPSMSLVHALEAVRPVYKLEHKNRMARETLGKHLGHSTLNGRALSKIGALRAYGLIEGSGNELRVSDDAIHALMAPDGAPERLQALIRLALKPSLFNEIHIDFPSTHPSEENLRFWLVKEGFTSEAAGKAAATYLETMRLVSESPTDYNSPVTQEEPEMIPSPITEIKPRTPAPPMASLPIGKPRIVMNGGHLDIQASVDLVGLKQLQTMLQKYAEILEMMTPGKDEAAK